MDLKKLFEEATDAISKLGTDQKKIKEFPMKKEWLTLYAKVCKAKDEAKEANEHFESLVKKMWSTIEVDLKIYKGLKINSKKKVVELWVDKEDEGIISPFIKKND